MMQPEHMPMEDLKTKFYSLLQVYTDRETTGKLWHEIEEAYRSGSRAYHNLDHLRHMAGELAAVEDKFNDPAAVWLSLFYHDIVYKASSGANEEKSAALAVERLSVLSVEQERLERIRDLIIATKAHDAGNDPDTMYLLDADLAILGAERGAYRGYTRKIRSEYSIYPDFLYCRGRKKVVRHFLDMERIYKTSHFSSRYESQARANLSSELAEL
ncbi:MAG: hypothetical protein WBB45_00910 [Cyclobacteriaceae bacterium]